MTDVGLRSSASPRAADSNCHCMPASLEIAGRHLLLFSILKHHLLHMSTHLFQEGLLLGVVHISSLFKVVLREFNFRVHYLSANAACTIHARYFQTHSGLLLVVFVNMRK